ncbi:hypothetical protein NLJ89_g10691 [Agrocybe chaxingu]|uniref:Uncharacterized protein n=1 Tax=Agrocybe chaxingu TaxID=84603 RepID=A0A9W8MQP0_9AGAR|nr:hypothetical protein NLJ89_g10691 [Agrocybe chaxingu]
MHFGNIEQSVPHVIEYGGFGIQPHAQHKLIEHAFLASTTGGTGHSIDDFAVEEVVQARTDSFAATSSSHALEESNATYPTRRECSAQASCGHLLVKRAGQQHKNEAVGVLTTGFIPVPENAIYRTQNGVYTGKDVNKHAAAFVNAIHNAAPYISRSQSLNSGDYPKPSTGFRPQEPGNPAQPSGNSVSYHHPIHPKVLGVTLRTGAKDMPGSDRIVGWRSTHDGNVHIGVSYHDTTKPVPIAQGGGRKSKNHPFTLVHPEPAGKVKQFRAKAGLVGSRLWKGAKALPSKVVHGAKALPSKLVHGAKTHSVKAAHAVKSTAASLWHGAKSRLGMGKKKRH